MSIADLFAAGANLLGMIRLTETQQLLNGISTHQGLR